MKEFFDETASLPSLPSDFPLPSRIAGAADGWERGREPLCMQSAGTLPMTDSDVIDAEFVDDMENELEQLRMKCACSLPMTEGNEKTRATTLTLLFGQAEQVIRHGASTPFSLSAQSLFADTRRCDCPGPAKFGFYYEQMLTAECQFLIRRAISELDILDFYRLVTTWNQNRSRFRCDVIGAVLAKKLAHFQKRIGGAKWK